MSDLAIPPFCYLPLCRSVDTWKYVLRPLPSESHAFNTKARCPALMLFEVEEHSSASDTLRTPKKNSNRNGTNNNNNNNNNNNGRTQGVSSNSRVSCTFCWMTNHTTPDCRSKQNEFANHPDRLFIASESHRRLVNLFTESSRTFRKSEDLRASRRAPRCQLMRLRSHSCKKIGRTELRS